MYTQTMRMVNKVKKREKKTDNIQEGEFSEAKRFSRVKFHVWPRQ